MKPITLTELTGALDMDCEELGTFVDVEKGCIVSVEQDLLSAVENGDEIDSGDLPEWQKEELELAREIVEHYGKRFIKAPSKFDFHEYGHMERFIGTVTDPQAYEQLSRSIHGKGAFRYFKDTAARLGLLESWYDYRDQAVRNATIAWAEEFKIPYVDDQKKTKQN